MAAPALCYFVSQQALAAWLQQHAIDLTQWGRGDAKTVQDLWIEYQKGESAFQAAPARRLVTVVQVRVQRDDRVLVEAAQELGDGRHRRRGNFPSEKINPGEDVGAAAVRCLMEELGVAETAVMVGTDRPLVSHIQRQSPSYPDLLTEYTIYVVSATVAGLPAHDFWRDNANFGPGDPVRRHLWSWQKMA